MPRYAYRPVRSPEDLLPGERLVTFNLANPHRAMQGGRDLLPREVTCFYGERELAFRSRIRTR